MLNIQLDGWSKRYKMYHTPQYTVLLEKRKEEKAQHRTLKQMKQFNIVLMFRPLQRDCVTDVHLIPANVRIWQGGNLKPKC